MEGKGRGGGEILCFFFLFFFGPKRTSTNQNNGCGGCVCVCVCINEHFRLVFGLMVFVLFLSGFQVSVKDSVMFFPFRLFSPTCDV